MIISPALPNLFGYLWHLTQRYIFQLIPAIAIFSWFFIKQLPGRLRILRSRYWETAQGTIETIEVHTFNSERGEHSTADLGYSFHLAGERYAGYYSRQFRSQQAAWDYANRLKHRATVVRYKPGRPEISALRPGDQNSECELRPKSNGFSMHLYQLMTRSRS
jgi:hypothetical protein